MNEKLKEFFVRLTEDYKFRAEFLSTQSAMEGYNKAKPYIEGVSFDEFKDGLRLIHNKISHKNNKSLADNELRNVSGGSVSFEKILKSLEGIDTEFLKSLF